MYIDNKPPSIIHFKVVCGRFLVVASFVWPFIFCIITFILFFIYHPDATDRVRTIEQIPTISGTGQLVPESIFFTYGLHFEAALLALLFTLIYTQFKSKIAEICSSPNQAASAVAEDSSAEEENNWTKWGFLCCGCCFTPECRNKNAKYLTFWNKILFGLGLSAAFFMSLTGSVTLSIQESVHTAFAAVMFVSAALHLFFFYFILMIIVIGVMWVYCDTHYCLAAAVDLIVVLEYTSALALLVYLFRFYEVVKDAAITACIPLSAEAKLTPSSGVSSSPSSSPQSGRAAGLLGAYAVEHRGRDAAEEKVSVETGGVGAAEEGQSEYAPPARSPSAAQARQRSGSRQRRHTLAFESEEELKEAALEEAEQGELALPA
jgi:uncharacterized membrane protein YqjE